MQCLNDVFDITAGSAKEGHSPILHIESEPILQSLTIFEMMRFKFYTCTSISTVGVISSSSLG